jgi:hypothetical protein
MIKKISLVLILIAILGYFFLINDPYLQYYKCKNSISAQNCNACKPESQKFKFLVDKEKNTVLQKSWIKDKLVGSEYLKNCIVTNDRNWICKTESNISPQLEIIYDEKMIDGVFISIVEWIENAKYHQPGELSTYYCAK